ncbi:MAG: hypothetical protein GY755_09440 [Chloroflexi bacterium]|nr:hypothetical protein [Chloroflexota bacterium]
MQKESALPKSDDNLAQVGQFPLRKLGIFERAMVIANEHAPFNIISVLRLEHAPSPEIVKEAIAKIQKRQPLLSARIVEDTFFEALPTSKLPFHVIKRKSKEQWREIAEQEMAFRYDHRNEALFRAIYIYSEENSEIILNVHHAIMDAASGMNLLDELLQLISGEVSSLPRLQLAPVFEAQFPPSHRGLRRIFTMAGYMLRQMGDMASFAWKTRRKRTPPVRLGGKSYTATLVLPEKLVNSLSHQGRKNGITLNSLLNAAQLLAVNKYLYAGKRLPMQTFAFADLRPYTISPTGPEQLANYISMMRFTVDVSGESDIWCLAQELHAQIYRSLKFGDKFSAAVMSEMLLKTFTTLKAMRFGATALNYSGNVPLKRQYGDINLVGVHGFVSGYDLGPEISSQARLFNDEVWWDFIYLDSDMDADLAEKIIAEIKLILENASQNHV